MSFLSPLLLFGALAVAIPIGLHFFYKARHVKLPWAAMEFLRLSIEQTSRRLKFQEYILLLLRCLALLLLAFALARPTSDYLAVSSEGESIDAVFVIDTSYSMGADDGDRSRFERAQSAAKIVLDNLPANSTVHIVTCDERAQSVGPRTPGNFDQAKQLIDELELTSLASNILPGLEEANASLDLGVNPRKEIYLFTDMQRGAWEPQAGAIEGLLTVIKERANVVVVRCGQPERKLTNLSILEISYPDGIPHTGSRLLTTILVRNSGDEPVNGAAVNLMLDNDPQSVESVAIDKIEPGETVALSPLSTPFRKDGSHVLTAYLGDSASDTQNQFDDIPGDNRLDHVVQVTDVVRVLVVDGAPNPRDPKRAGSHYVVNALLPIRDEQRGDYHIRVATISDVELGQGLLAAYDVIYFCNVPAIPNAPEGSAGLNRGFAQALAEYVRTGGGVILGLGDNVEAASYNAVLGSAGAKLLPYDLGETLTATPQKPLHPAPETTDKSSYLGRFVNKPYNVVAEAVDLTEAIRLVPKPDAASRVLMALDNGAPWLTSRVHGLGKVVLANTSFDETWTNWPIRSSAFVPFIYLSLSELLARGDSEANLVAGQTLRWKAPSAGRYDWVNLITDQRETIGKTNDDESPTLTVTDNLHAGVFRIQPEGEANLTGPLIAVHPNLLESESLPAINDDELKQLVNFEPVIVQAGDDVEAGLGSQERDREWTVWILLGLFMLSFGESIWAWFCGKAW